MSYEGSVEYLCAKGHYARMDCHARVPDKCSHDGCGELLTWVHNIDETNGYDERDPSTYPAPTVEIGFEDIPHTDHYGNNYFTKRSQYKPAEGSEWAKLLTPEEQAAADAEWEAEWERKQAIFGQYPDEFRIFLDEELVWHGESEEDFEDQFEKVEVPNGVTIKGCYPDDYDHSTWGT